MACIFKRPATKRLRLGLLLVLSVLAWGVRPASAGLELVGDDRAEFWPGEAPVRTSAFTSSASTRGVRGNRFQYQTFSVEEAFSLNRIFLQYEWVGDTGVDNSAPTETNFTKVRLVEIERTYHPDTGAENGITIGNVVIPQFSFIVSNLDGNGDPKITTTPMTGPWGFYAIELAWNGDSELILPARTGNEGYALEINGTYDDSGTSAIALIERTGDPYPLGRPWELNPSGGTTSAPYNSLGREIPVVLTAVPPVCGNGDFNCDGNVDALDYAVLRIADQPGDYELWAANYGIQNEEGSGTSVSSAVPEPGLASVIALGATLGCVLVRRRNLRNGM